jgi:hypothetical protein
MGGTDRANSPTGMTALIGVAATGCRGVGGGANVSCLAPLHHPFARAGESQSNRDGYRTINTGLPSQTAQRSCGFLHLVT